MIWDYHSKQYMALYITLNTMCQFCHIIANFSGTAWPILCKFSSVIEESLLFDTIWFQFLTLMSIFCKKTRTYGLRFIGSRCKAWNISSTKFSRIAAILVAFKLQDVLLKWSIFANVCLVFRVHFNFANYPTCEVGENKIHVKCSCFTVNEMNE